MDNQKSVFNQQINPQQEDSKKNLLLNLFQGGLLNTLVKREMRVTVETLLRQKHPDEFVASNWDGIAQMIINVGLKATYPSIYRDAASDDQVKRVKETYPLQLQMLNGVFKMIDRGKTIQQMLTQSKDRLMIDDI